MQNAINEPWGSWLWITATATQIYLRVNSHTDKYLSCCLCRILIWVLWNLIFLGNHRNSAPLKLRDCRYFNRLSSTIVVIRLYLYSYIHTYKFTNTYFLCSIAESRKTFTVCCFSSKVSLYPLTNQWRDEGWAWCWLQYFSLELSCRM